MSSPGRSHTRALIALLALALLLAALGAWRPGGSARAASVGALQNQISSGQSRIGSLSSQLGAASAKLSQLNGSVSAIERRISQVQSQLDTERAQLLALRSQLDRARTRLAQLESFQTRAEQTLSGELVNAYESDRPDVVTVVLEARGFNDLLENLSFAARVRKQTVQVTSAVKAARRATAAQAIRLGALEQRQQKIATQVLGQRDALARDKVALVSQQLAAARDRSSKAGALADAKGHVAALTRQLNQLQAQQAAAAAAAAGQSSTTAPTGGASGSAPAGVSPGSGGFTFPLPKSAVSPPGTWSQDQGVDMSAPGDTPEYAVCSGTIVLHGIGGFGPWAPVLHCDSPLGGYDYVYYGHAGPANQLSIGTHVSAGEVMSSVGPGIVGMSTGPHIEIGFSDGSGTPVGGGSSSEMMSLLQSSY